MLAREVEDKESGKHLYLNHLLLKIVAVPPNHRFGLTADGWPSLFALFAKGWGTNYLTRLTAHASPTPGVQSHDILYRLSRDILYTPARERGWERAMAWKTMDVHEQRVRFVVEATPPEQSIHGQMAVK